LKHEKSGKPRLRIHADLSFLVRWTLQR